MHDSNDLDGPMTDTPHTIPPMPPQISPPSVIQKKEPEVNEDSHLSVESKPNIHVYCLPGSHGKSWHERMWLDSFERKTAPEIKEAWEDEAEEINANWNEGKWTEPVYDEFNLEELRALVARYNGGWNMNDPTAATAESLIIESLHEYTLQECVKTTQRLIEAHNKLVRTMLNRTDKIVGKLETQEERTERQRIQAGLGVQPFLKGQWITPTEAEHVAIVPTCIECKHLIQPNENKTFTPKGFKHITCPLHLPAIPICLGCQMPIEPGEYMEVLAKGPRHLACPVKERMTDQEITDLARVLTLWGWFCHCVGPIKVKKGPITLCKTCEKIVIEDERD